MEGWDGVMEGIYSRYTEQGALEGKEGRRNGAHLYPRPLKGHRGSCLREARLESAACHSRGHGTTQGRGTNVTAD